MKLNILVKSEAKSTKIQIPVGNGKHSFKWLALASAQHLMLQAPANKRSSRLVGTKELISLSRRMPKDVYTSDTSFFHPDHLVCEHLQDGEEVTVELYDNVPLDEYSRPILSKWCRIAFYISEEHQQERENLIEQKVIELKRLQGQRRQAELKRRLDWERPRLATMTTIMKEQLVDGKTIEGTVRKEWALILGSGRLDNVVKDDEEKTKILDFFIQHYVSLSELYKHFSAINHGGGNGSEHTLEFIEYSKFLIDANIFTARNSSIMQKLFLESYISSSGKRGRGGGPSKSSASIEVEICKYEFLLSLVKIASYKFIALKRREQSMLRRKGHTQAAISHAVTPTPSEALNMLYEENLRPIIDNMPVAGVKDAIGSKGILLLFYEHLQTLTQVFNKYAECTSETPDSKDKMPTGTMTADTFLAFATEAQFLASSSNDAEEENNACTALTVRNAYSASQKEPTCQGETHHNHNDENIADGGIAFPAFLEAVARLGIMKFIGSSISTDGDNQSQYIECIQPALKCCFTCVD